MYFRMGNEVVPVSVANNKMTLTQWVLLISVLAAIVIFAVFMLKRPEKSKEMKDDE